MEIRKLKFEIWPEFASAEIALGEAWVGISTMGGEVCLWHDFFPISNFEFRS